MLFLNQNKNQAGKNQSVDFNRGREGYVEDSFQEGGFIFVNVTPQDQTLALHQSHLPCFLLALTVH